MAVSGFTDILKTAMFVDHYETKLLPNINALCLPICPTESVFRRPGRPVALIPFCPVQTKDQSGMENPDLPRGGGLGVNRSDSLTLGLGKVSGSAYGSLGLGRAPQLPSRLP